MRDAGGTGQRCANCIHYSRCGCGSKFGFEFGFWLGFKLGCGLGVRLARMWQRARRGAGAWLVASQWHEAALSGRHSWHCVLRRRAAQRADSAYARVSALSQHTRASARWLSQHTAGPKHGEAGSGGPEEHHGASHARAESACVGRETGKGAEVSNGQKPHPENTLSTGAAAAAAAVFGLAGQEMAGTDRGSAGSKYTRRPGCVRQSNHVVVQLAARGPSAEAAGPQKRGFGLKL